MALRPLSLGKQSNQGAHPSEGVARLVNCYAEAAGEEQRVQWPIRAVEGLSSLGTLTGSGGVRAMIGVRGTGYAVAGRVVHQFEAGGSSTVLGGLPSDGPVTMAPNSLGDVAICCDGTVKIISGGSLTDVADADIGTPTSICCVNDIFVTGGSDGYLRSSAIQDGTDWDPLDVAKALPDASQLLRVITRGTSVLALGATSARIWAYDPNAGASGFPFQPGYAFQVGCFAPSSVIQAPVVTTSIVADAICWAASDYQGAYAGVVMLDGDTPRKISTFAVDRDFKSVDDPNEITACAWSSNGHSYIAWTLPGVTTWVYDTASNLWHERRSYGLNHWRVRCTTVLGNRVVAGHRTTPTLYFIDDSGDEAGTELAMRLQMPPAHMFPRRMKIPALYVDCATGVGLNTTTAANLDPTISMEMSADGVTWTTAPTRDLGRLGQTQQLISWHGLGMTDHRGVTFALEASAAVVRSFQSVMADV